ncbi:MAG: hypothetical protein V4751_00095 [Pseudomonadota bacterium]
MRNDNSMNDLKPYEFVAFKTHKPLFREEKLIGITIRSPQRDMFSGNETIEIQDIESIEVIGRESGRSVGGAALGAVIGGALTGGVGLLLGGALGAGRNEVPIFLHLKNGDKRYIKIQTKHLGKIEGLVRVLAPSEPDVAKEARVEIECPWCAERILAKALLCKHCGKEVKST